jgi:hypothetical protein
VELERQVKVMPVAQRMITAQHQGKVVAVALALRAKVVTHTTAVLVAQVYLLALTALLHSALAVVVDTLRLAAMVAQAVVDAVVSGLLSLALAMRVLQILEVVEAVEAVLVAARLVDQVLSSFVIPVRNAGQVVQ